MDLNNWLMLLEGAWTTLWISLFAIFCGGILGLLIALMRRRCIPIIDQSLAFYVSIARATPVVTLTLFVFFGLPRLGLQLDRNLVAILALTLNTTAFNAEVWRSVLTGFPRDQIEAAQACGFTAGQTLRRIMLPQMVTTSLPGLINEMSFLIKVSPAVAVIGIADLTRMTNRIAAVTYESLPPLMGACALYMLLIAGLIYLQRLSDRRAMRLAG